MSTNKAEEVLKNIDTNKLRAAMADVVGSILTGEEPITVTTQVELKIPKAIHDLVAEVCKIAEIHPSEVFSSMASKGFKGGLEAILNMAASVEEETDLPEIEMGALPKKLEGLMEQLKPLKGLAEQLQEFQKSFSVNQNITKTNKKKDS